jgi:hypothetical protein
MVAQQRNASPDRRPTWVTVRMGRTRIPHSPVTHRVCVGVGNPPAIIRERWSYALVIHTKGGGGIIVTITGASTSQTQR